MQSTIILTKGMKRQTVMLVVVVMLWMGACSKSRRPPGVLNEEQLSEILIDIYVTESKFLPIRIPRDSTLRLFEPFESSLLAKKNVSKAVLKETYRYYLDHPAEFEKVYEIVMDTLNLREQRTLHAPKK